MFPVEQRRALLRAVEHRRRYDAAARAAKAA
jgi:hypothetical protein